MSKCEKGQFGNPAIGYSSKKAHYFNNLGVNFRGIPSISTTSFLSVEEKAPISVKEILTTEEELAQRGHPEGYVTVQEPVSIDIQEKLKMISRSCLF